MRVIITAGPAYEPLDQARRLTNFSTGQLGAELAVFFFERGHEVVLLRGAMATFPFSTSAFELIPFETGGDLSQRLFNLSRSKTWDAVFHAAAVGDFKFGKVFSTKSDGSMSVVSEGKISTKQGRLLAELLPAPKILPSLREWFPSARIFGWKYEVDGSPDDAIAAGHKQLSAGKTDACVINGPGYGNGYRVLRSSGQHVHCDNRPVLFAELDALLKS